MIYYDVEIIDTEQIVKDIARGFSMGFKHMIYEPTDTELAYLEIQEHGQFDETGGTLGDADFDDSRAFAAAADRPELSDS